MKTQLIKFTTMLMVTVGFLSCDDDEKPETEPVVTTSAVTNVTTTTATGGGEITDDGSSVVIVSGLAYSSTNATPTIADSKTEETITSGTFTSNLEGLAPGTTYYVRAYATNSVGTGYGTAVEFTTANAAPTASNVSISGVAEVNKVLTASYTYSDPENNAESGSSFQWYIAEDAGGTGEAAIAGATTSTYKPLDADEFKYIRVGVTPKAATGNTMGTEARSNFVGPVAVRTTVTFTYNGAEVTYGILTSSVTGRKWLDRNLGAPNAPTAHNDYANYGHLFQWGRLADGHQIITWNSSNQEPIGVATTNTLSTTDSPGHALFILNASASPYDWRNPSNNDLWQGVNGINNPCPQGWRIPTYDEWVAENIPDLETAYTQLKITLSGTRSGENGLFSAWETFGQYWSSSTFPNPAFIRYQLGGKSVSTSPRAGARSCRCIKNE